MDVQYDTGREAAINEQVDDTAAGDELILKAARSFALSTLEWSKQPWCSKIKRTLDLTRRRETFQ